MKTVHLKLASAIALHGSVIRAGTVVEVEEKLAVNLLQRGKAVLATDKDAPQQLRQDGPTVAEFVAAGYLAKNYPPAGYESCSTAEEIQAAIDAQEAAEQPQPAAAADQGAADTSTADPAQPGAAAPAVALAPAEQPQADAKPARSRRGQ